MGELEGRPKTSNERVFSRTIRHAVYLQRYGVGLGNDIVGFLDEFVFPDIVAKLQVRLDRIASRGLDTGPWTTKRYKEMLGDVWNIVHDGTQESRKRLQAELRKLATVEAAAGNPVEANLQLGHDVGEDELVEKPHDVVAEADPVPLEVDGVTDRAREHALVAGLGTAF